MKRLLALFPVLLPAVALGQAGVYDNRGTTGSEFGTAVTTVGDINGDGVPDYAAGAPHGTGLQPDSGYVQFYSGASGGGLWRVNGLATGSLFGWSVAGLGDIDNDLIGDLIVGAPGSNANAGEVYIVSGATGTITVTWVGSGADRLGWSVAGLGDASGDGWPDYAMGMPGWSSDRGIVTLASGFDNAQLRSYLGQFSGDQFGYSMDGAGDVDGDNKNDLVVGAPFWDRVVPPALIPDAGKAYVLSGGSQQTLYTYNATAGWSHLGWSVAGGEDLNLDGIPDIALGLPNLFSSAPFSSRLDVISGASPHPILFQVAGQADGDRFGTAVDLIPDANGDGRGDVIVGAPNADSNGITESGRASVLSGLDGVELFRIEGYLTGDHMGGAVASAGLLNADAAGDVFAGAPQADHNTLGADAGWVRSALGGAPVPWSYCTPKINSAGCTPSIGYVGVVSQSISDYFLILGGNVLPNKAGILIWSYQTNAAPFFGGTLCVKAPIKRTPLQTATQTGPNPCDGQFEFHMSHDYMAKQNIPAGAVIYTQFWSRDSGHPAPNGVGLTNGLAIPILP